MNSITQLNTWGAGNITVTNQSSYSITWSGALGNLGNTTQSATANTYFAPTKQISITSISNPVKDIVVQLQFANTAGVANVQYTKSDGPYITQNNAVWTIGGIRSINQYNSAFGNTRVNLNSGFTGNIVYTTLVSDQIANSATWTTRANIHT
jgi:hypothetical protein